jgi:hypothetical protein
VAAWTRVSTARSPSTTTGTGAVCWDRPVAIVTIAQALHWMQAPELFRAAAPLIRPGGGVAVVTNGTPL